MKIASFEFNLRELSGSFGNLGTFLPLAVGYIAVCGLDPAGLLVMMGLANLATGILYRLPIPIEPMKVIAAAAIAQKWSPSLIYAAGFSMGVVWLLFAASGVASRVARITPAPVVRGIQATLGILLAMEAFRMLSTSWLLGGFALLIGFLLRSNRHAPAAVVLVVIGVAFMGIQGQLAGIAGLDFTVPSFTLFSLREVWQSLVLAGFAQIPLTITNATIATSCLISAYWPERHVSPRKLSLSQGLMNLAAPFFGGMPMCHGAGGLAGQYYFGARTGGTNIMEGLIELSLGLFLASSVTGLFGAFPKAVTGAMLLLVGFELLKFARDVQGKRDILSLATTVAVSLASNMAFGFLAGIAVSLLASRLSGAREEDLERPADDVTKAAP
jgi:MFS superfamily sulfate permease-like transporter